MLCSRRQRTCPASGGSTTRSDFAARRDKRSKTSQSSTSPPVQTASAAPSDQPPWNTERRRRRHCSAGDSSSYDQSTSALNVCWRGSAVREPPVSRRKRSLRRPSICSGVRTRTRAAASSKASGMPSSRVQTDATAAALPALNRKVGRAAVARSTNKRTESQSPKASGFWPPGGGRPSGGRGRTDSPPMPRASRLVASTESLGHDFSSVSVSRATASIRCSQLSRISSSGWERRASKSAVRSRPASSRRLRTPAISCSIRAGSDSSASSTSHVPPGYSSRASAASCKASRVLPVPPVPTSVTIRESASLACAAARSASRPIKEVRDAGRLVGNKSGRRSGGNPAGRPGADASQISDADAKPFSVWRPKDRRDTPGGRASCTSFAAESDSRVWPPCAAASSRAARLRAAPK